MPIRYYPARIERDDDGSYTFQAVDIPGALSAGDSVEAALAFGTEALQLAVDTWDAADDGPLPEPSPLSADMKIGDNGAACIVQLVPVALSEPSVKINVTIPGDLLKRIDMVAGNYGRSGFIAEACRDKLASRANILPDPNSNEVRVMKELIKQQSTDEVLARLAEALKPHGARDVQMGLVGPASQGNLKNFSSARTMRGAQTTVSGPQKHAK